MGTGRGEIDVALMGCGGFIIWNNFLNILFNLIYIIMKKMLLTLIRDIFVGEFVLFVFFSDVLQFILFFYLYSIFFVVRLFYNMILIA